MSDTNTATSTDAGDAAAAADDTNTDTGDTNILTGDKTNSDGDANASTDDTTNTDENQDGDAGEQSSGDVIPDTYADFNLPEGMELNETALAEANPLFKDLGLTQEQGQSVIDLYAKQIQAGSEKQLNDFNQLKNDWRDSSKKDGEFGGDKFDENVKVAQSAISKYGTSEFKQLLNDYGIGNHPEVIRFMVRVGHTLKEDVPGSNGSTPTTAEDAVSILYPNTKDT